MIYDMSVATQELGFIDITGEHPGPDGKMQVDTSFTRTKVAIKENSDIPPGNCTAEGLLAGTCGREEGYYLAQLPIYNGSTRFMHDLGNSQVQDEFLERTIALGYTSDPKNREAVRDVMVHTPFHEGVVRIHELNPDTNREQIPIVEYVPGRLSDGRFGLKQTFVYTNFQEGFEEGAMAVLDPALVCDDHTRADTPENEASIRATGWTVQCTRDEEFHGHKHEKKGTRGHTQAIGTATEGKMPISLRSMTPVSRAVLDYCKSDPTIPGQYEVMGCIAHAHGWALAREYQPDVVVFEGDGFNTLNMVGWYQVYAPNAKIVVVGKTPPKLKSIQQINPNQILTVTTDGHDYCGLDDALRQVSQTGKADIIIPTIALPESQVASRVKEGGDIIWWAAAVSEHATRENKRKPYNNHYPYGGAPAAEMTADAVFSWLVQNNPEALEQFTSFPGATYVDMGPEAADIVKEWFNNGAKYVDKIDNISKKPFIRMGSFKSSTTIPTAINGDRNRYI